VLIFLLLCYIANDEKSLEVRFTDNAPVIDGVMDEVWQQADSAYDFVQHSPYEKEQPTEKTVVYALQDEGNLYFAFACHAKIHGPVACLIKDEDHVSIGLDPFGSKTTAYYFRVFASGIINDGWIHDDGRSYDDSWEGVWYRAVKVYDDHYVVEFKIPFKSIRYKKGLEKWGVQFMRYCAANRETEYWTEVLQLDGDKISEWPELRGVKSKTGTYHFELYPEAYIRHDRYEGMENKWKPSLSLNAKWDITSQMTLNATVYPDFAQIESDPFTLNLGRYETYLDERRPFFLAGKDIFRLSDFGEGVGFFEPLEIYYSRRIGKSMNGEAVPIIAGLKLTNKTEDWNFGMFGAYTDEYVQHDTVIEAHRGFGVVRLKRQMFDNSALGLLFSSSMVDQDDYNYVVGVDGVHRTGRNQIILQGALSDKNEKRGWAAKSAFFGFLGNFLSLASVEVIDDSFDVSNVGYVPWAGQKEIFLASGPYWQFARGFVSSTFILPGINIIQAPGSDDWSVLGFLEQNSGFRNHWGYDMNFFAGTYYEADTNYLYKSGNLSVWGNLFQQQINFGGWYGYTYNYLRDFIAWQGSNWFSYSYALFEHMSAGLNVNAWLEWDTLNNLVGVTPRLRPRIDYRFNADMKLGIFSEFVMTGNDFSDQRLYSIRPGLLFSWNFKPKSWFYIALNDYCQQNDQGKLEHQYLIGAIKAKYLIYF
jgi:hypothetical protein